MQDPKPGMSSKRDVLLHPRWGTVHELWPNGTTRCGNGLTIPIAYVPMQADRLPPTARGCLRCAWIVQRD